MDRAMRRAELCEGWRMRRMELWKRIHLWEDTAVREIELWEGHSNEKDREWERQSFVKDRVMRRGELREGWRMRKIGWERRGNKKDTAIKRKSAAWRARGMKLTKIADGYHHTPPYPGRVGRGGGGGDRWQIWEDVLSVRALFIPGSHCKSDPRPGPTDPACRALA
jgi:hypothetical protein